MRIALVLIAWAAQASAQEETVTVVATGGVTSWDGLFREGDAQLRLSLGSSLFESEEGMATRGEFAADAFQSAEFDAVNLSVSDLSQAKDLGSLRSKFPIALLAEGTAREYVVKKCGSLRVAVVGYSGEPSRRDALGAALKKAVGESDVRILLAELTLEDAAALCRQLDSVTLCLIPGGAPFDPEPFRAGTAWVMSVPTGGKLSARISARFAGESVREVNMEMVGPSVASVEKASALRKKHGIQARLDEQWTEPKKRVSSELAIPDRLEPEKAASLGLVRSNRSANLMVHSVALRAAYGGLKAPPKSAFVVVDTEWENIIPLTFTYERQVPTMYKIPNLADHLYLVVNGRRAARLRSDADSLAGHLLVQGFSLERVGSRRRGNLVFEVPADGLETLEIRFYDYAHGHMTVPLLARPKGAKPAEPKLVGEIRENEVMSAGVYDLRKTAEFGGRKAPSGMIFVSFDLLCVSRYLYPADATAFDPKAKKGDQIQLGCVCDWEDARKRVTAVVDGEYGYTLVEGTNLPAKPRFLPDVKTGERLAFLVPEKFASLEIRCEYPNARLPLGEVIHPAPLVLPVEGARPDLPKRESVVGIDDDVFRVDVVGQTVAGETGGQKARADQKFLILDVTVENRGKKTEIFQVPAQLKYTTERGAQLAWHAATKALPHAGTDQVSIPSGQRRTFQIVFEIPATEKKHRLAYFGVSKAVTVAFGPDAEEKPKKRACGACKRAAAPDDRFCEGCGEKVGD